MGQASRAHPPPQLMAQTGFHVLDPPALHGSASTPQQQPSLTSIKALRREGA